MHRPAGLDKTAQHRVSWMNDKTDDRSESSTTYIPARPPELKVLGRTLPSTASSKPGDSRTPTTILRRRMRGGPVCPEAGPRIRRLGQIPTAENPPSAREGRQSPPLREANLRWNITGTCQQHLGSLTSCIRVESQDIDARGGGGGRQKLRAPNSLSVGRPSS